MIGLSAQAGGCQADMVPLYSVGPTGILKDARSGG